ncbi:CLIP domain-containing serine protease B4-like isoform X2 [Armigeres subalbatus]|uniref:CLIP domain-containing serine protease B4-like isoform X2 n=1 Tax=Armigeres subalbatus TaxID=124917 RepID=UPI002ED3478F
MTNILQDLFLWLSIFGIASSQDPDHCINTKGKHGKCVHIDYCPELLEIAQKRVVSAHDSQLLKSNSCGKAMVCCSQSMTETKVKKMTLPDIDVCGFNHVSDRIIGGTETELEQYRWMVVIERLEAGTREVICGGSLINTLYVLTAAHCFKGLTKAEDLILRLGEHNLSSDPDCDSSNNCNAPVIYANVSQIINHPNYRSERNDVALLKLATPIEYTNYVLPICLPVLASQQKEFLNKHVFAAGWGTNGTGEALSNIKMHVELKITNLDECEILFRSEPGEMHLCAKSSTDEVGDTCDGDSGGPLMIELQGSWFQVGIVNFGLPCGSIFPAVYARVSHFMEWIQDNLLE